MLKRILLLLPLLSTTLVGQASLKLPDWNLRNDFASSKVWQHNKYKTFYVSIEQSAIPSEKEYFDFLKNPKTLAQNKADTLALIGVKNWKMEESSWKTISSKKFFEISGTYTDNFDELVYFKEYHFVSGKSVVKTLFTSTQKSQLDLSEAVYSFLSQVKLGIVNE